MKEIKGDQQIDVQKRMIRKNKHARQAANMNSPNKQRRSHSMHTKQQPMTNCNKCGGHLKNLNVQPMVRNA